MCITNPNQPAQTALPAVAQEQDPAILAARDRERRRQAVARSGSTLLTGGAGSASGPQAPKTLLGA